MKFTDEIKKQIEEAKTVEEKKAIIMQSGIELTDEELEAVNGGLFKNIDGVCGYYVCKECGFNGVHVTKKFMLVVTFHPHPCIAGKQTQPKCENCIHDKGGIFCEVNCVHASVI